MNPQRYTGQQTKRNSQDHRQELQDWAWREAHPTDAEARAEQAARSVMHPDGYDSDWRHYFATLSG